jgi:hypothetical protein
LDCVFSELGFMVGKPALGWGVLTGCFDDIGGLTMACVLPLESKLFIVLLFSKVYLGSATR